MGKGRKGAGILWRAGPDVVEAEADIAVAGAEAALVRALLPLAICGYGTSWVCEKASGKRAGISIWDISFRVELGHN